MKIVIVALVRNLTIVPGSLTRFAQMPMLNSDNGIGSLNRLQDNPITTTTMHDNAICYAICLMANSFRIEAMVVKDYDISAWSPVSQSRNRVSRSVIFLTGYDTR